MTTLSEVCAVAGLGPVGHKHSESKNELRHHFAHVTTIQKDLLPQSLSVLTALDALNRPADVPIPFGDICKVHGTIAILGK